VPTLVSGGLKWASISAGTNHTCGIGDTQGVSKEHLYCWGNNSSGQLGDGTTTDTTVPLLISDAVGWALVTSGESHTAAVTTVGAGHIWGKSDYGQAGEGVGTETLRPIRIYPPPRR